MNDCVKTDYLLIIQRLLLFNKTAKKSENIVKEIVL